MDEQAFVAMVPVGGVDPPSAAAREYPTSISEVAEKIFHVRR